METPAHHEHEVTRLLAEWSRGDSSAAERLVPLLYDELRALAGRLFEDEPADHTLQPTALLHEVYLRLARRPGPQCADRVHFFRVAAKAMRQLLTDSARRRRAAKRGGGRTLVALDTGLAEAPTADVDVVALDTALTKLSSLGPRHSQIVELRYLTGLTTEETAEVLGVSRRTVELDWRVARAWLRRELRAKGCE